jgi:broad specificity phosphatase PhoE
MEIFLVRHGESEGNVDKDVHRRLPDHAINLSERGRAQAKKAGEFLARWFVARENNRPIESVNFSKNPISGLSILDVMTARHIVTGKHPFRLWTSPYARARQTSDEILGEIERLTKCVPAHGRREHVLLAEQQFGLFDGLSDEDLAKRYPDEFAHYKKCEDMEGRFWARMPLGESRFDVAVRVHQAFGTFHRDAQKHGVQRLVIVAHGTTIRAFVQQWLHLPFEWFDKESNPKNCSIRAIIDGEDKGYIYEGGDP